MKLKHCAILTVINGLLLGLLVVGLFLPLVAAIQDLSGDTKPTGPTEMPWMARVVLHPAFGILLVTVAITAVGVSIRAATSDPAERGWWIVVAIVNALPLFGACMALFLVPKFAGLFKDMGIK